MQAAPVCQKNCYDFSQDATQIVQHVLYLEMRCSLYFIQLRTVIMVVPHFILQQ